MRKKLTKLMNLENKNITLIDKTSETRNAIFGYIVSHNSEVYADTIGEVAFLKSKWIELNKEIHEEVILK